MTFSKQLHVCSNRYTVNVDMSSTVVWTFKGKFNKKKNLMSKSSNLLIFKKKSNYSMSHVFLEPGGKLSELGR